MNFFQIFYQPLLNALIIIYNYLPSHSFGLAVIVLTVLIRLLLYPLASESIRIQKITSDLQPKIKEIKNKYKNDKEKQTLLTMDLFKENKLNPLKGVLLILIQVPIMIGLYYVFFYGITPEILTKLYPSVSNPGMIDSNFFGFDLAKGSLFMAIIAGVLQYFQTKMVTDLTPRATRNGGETDMMEEMQSQMQKYMLYFFPAVTVFIFWKLPSALSLYWITSSVFSIAQQYLVLRSLVSAKLGASVSRV
ncbi:MAG TPA: YidC/Oxa1 family membrane protein insertase [Candidatus Paceibacterota bacterium]|nr:YidC/Oxa1 family membrane protein insertase [Candidatus Pacearchaeota archaeon]HRZ51194.1 YidC/Oxa1 family membrane protein insertase [Candidatus Paceibacterota bacterium]HSA36916.1 YidC/Oxa1 family membrane protein insertase [Candidatus Paceibacterota bacterium]